MSTKKKLLEAAAGNAGGGATYVDDVFSTYLYEGTGSAQTITNGIDLSGEGGLVWIKNRSSTSNHALFDTVRGPEKLLFSDDSAAEQDRTADNDSLGAFNSNGFMLQASTGNRTNQSGEDFASWTFRKAPSFFDVVTYTGDGLAGRTVAHNLGSVPAVMIIKRTSTSGSNWRVYHTSIGNGQALSLNTTDAAAATTSLWNSTTPTDSVFTLGDNSNVNQSGQTFVAYLFAHDDSDESSIKCGSFSSTSSSSINIDLGWEPQWLLIKTSASTGGWGIFDSQRGFAGFLGGNTAGLVANVSNAEATYTNWALNSSGFSYTETSSGRDFIYMAIRRPNKPAEEFEADELFGLYSSSVSGNNTNPVYRTSPEWPVDFSLFRATPSASANINATSRLIAPNYLKTNLSDAEQALTEGYWDYMNGWRSTGGTNQFAWLWRRAPGYFDVVAYNGDASNPISHNLGVAPELIITKEYAHVWDWYVWGSVLGDNKFINLNLANAATNYTFNTTVTATTFRSGISTSNQPTVAYLFASVDGISKVGSYTGTGNDLNVDCGFSAGARFVLIKRTDSTGDWYFWDSLRGIVVGNDPYLLLNETADQVTNTDYIDPLASGFTVTSSAPAALNNNGGTYIFYAIA